MHELTDTAHTILSEPDLKEICTHKSRCVLAVPGGRPDSGVGLTSRMQTQRHTRTP